MPPRHGDSPLGHCAFGVAFGYRSENAPRLFVEKRVEQRNATSEIRLDVRRTRYRKRNISDAAQIARFWSGCGLSIAQDVQSTDKRDDTKGASPTRSQHSQGYSPMSVAANSKRLGGYCGGRTRHSVRADSLGFRRRAEDCPPYQFTQIQK